MISICFALLLSITYSASEVVPIQSSHVDVRRSGSEFSYNIQENRGVADVVPVIQPIVKAIHVDNKIVEKPVEIVHHTEPIMEQKIESRANIEVKDAKKPEHHLMQPLLISPMDYYSYYLPYHGYSLTRASLIAPYSHITSVPYPYTLVRHV